MLNRYLRLTLLLAVLAVSLAVGPMPSARAVDLGSVPPIADGIRGYQATTRTAVGSVVKLWIFLPSEPTAKVGCVLIAPAGTPEIWGRNLGNQAECTPYVDAGFVVVAYSLDGNVTNQQNDSAVKAGHKAFVRAHGGIADAYAAIRYIDKNLASIIDTKRLYTAGHSSAGTVSLLVAANSPRIRGCIAYCPRTDLVHEKADIIANESGRLPDVKSFLTRTSPTTNIHKLRCPTFLFTSDSDSVVPSKYVVAFSTRLSRLNHHVTLLHVPDGDHYDSMINTGLPAGVTWLQNLDSQIQAHEPQ